MKFSSWASQEIVLRKRLPFPCKPKPWLDAKSESPKTARRAFLFSAKSFVATTANETGPLISVFSSKLAWFDFISDSAQLRSLDLKSSSTLIPVTGGFAGETDRTRG